MRVVYRLKVKMNFFSNGHYICVKSNKKELIISGKRG